MNLGPGFCRESQEDGATDNLDRLDTLCHGFSQGAYRYRRWHAMARSALDHSPNGERRPYWLKRPLKPVRSAYKLPDKPFSRED